MTAVAVQQPGSHRQTLPRPSPLSSNMPSPHQSRPQSYTASGPSHMRQEPPIQNGTSGPVIPRPAVSNDPVQVVNGHRASQSEIDPRVAAAASNITPRGIRNDAVRDRRTSLQSRPTSAPEGTAENEQSGSERERTKRRPKPLMRAKSDFGPRGEEEDSQEEEESQYWGARHGFEDHYASEEYVSQLANVGRTFLFL